MSLKIVSFDVGLRNLAVAILSMELPNPMQPKQTKELSTELSKPMDGFQAPWNNCALEHWELIDVLKDNHNDATNALKVTIAEYVPLVHATLRKRLPLFQDADAILIESQPNIGKEKVQNVALLMYSFLYQQYYGVSSAPLVAFVSARLKLRVLVDPRNFYQVLKPGKTDPNEPLVPVVKPPTKVKKSAVRRAKYKKNKQDSLPLAQAVLAQITIKCPMHVQTFQKAKKRDDYADALLQGISYLQKCPPARK